MIQLFFKKNNNNKIMKNIFNFFPVEKRFLHFYAVIKCEV